MLSLLFYFFFFALYGLQILLTSLTVIDLPTEIIFHKKASNYSENVLTYHDVLHSLHQIVSQC